MRGRTAGRLLVALALAAGVWYPAPAVADRATTVGSLPTGEHGPSAIWDGERLTVFGNGAIYRYTPDGGVEQLGAERDIAGHHSSAVFDGAHAYVFGGYRYGPHSTIKRYDPETDTLTTVAHLPSARYGASAVFDGTYAYVFGGQRTLGGAPLDEIVRYDPATNAVTVLGTRLPTARSYTAAAHVGGIAYVIGGYDPDEGWGTYEILAFDPAAGTVTTVGWVPYYLWGAMAFADHAQVYVVGGIHAYEPWGERYYLDQMRRFDPASGNTTYMSATLPQASGYAAVAAAGSRGAYIAGGYWTECASQGGYGSCQYYNYHRLDSVVWYDLAPGPPRSVHALPGTGGGYSGPGAITVTWQPPDYATVANPVESYRISRRANLGSYAQVGEVSYGDGGYFIDAGCYVGQLCTYRVTAVTANGEGPPGTSYPITGLTTY